MRNVTMLNWMSLDGYYASADGSASIDWVVQDPAVDAVIHGGAPAGDGAAAGDGAPAAGSGDRPGVLLLGGVTFRGFHAGWVPHLTDPAADPAMHAIAQELTGMRKIVFSRTMTASDWANSEFPTGDPVSVVRDLKAELGGDLLIMGSGSIVRQLTEAKLIDDYFIVLTPVVLGAGQNLFAAVPQMGLSLVSAQRFDSGNVVLHYPGGLSRRASRTAWFCHRGQRRLAGMVQSWIRVPL